MIDQAIAPRREASAATAQTLLAKVREIAPSLAARGPEFDAARSMPMDVVADLRDIVVFGMYAPMGYGGPELDFPDSLDILAALAEADGSAGWTATRAPIACSHMPASMSYASWPISSTNSGR